MQKIYNQISSDKAIINIYKTIEENENINKGWAYHNLDHIKNVTNIVETILNELNYSEELITKAKIASFMHDIGCLEGKEDHANRSYEYAKEYFKRNNINFEDIDLVLEAIKIHSDGFNTKNIIALALILSDKLDIKKSRVAPEGTKVEGMRQYQYINDIKIRITQGTLIINFLTDKKINLKELNEYYFTKKVFNAIKSFSNKVNLKYKILLNNKEWILEENNLNYQLIKNLNPNDLIALRKVLGWKEINYNQIKKGLKNTMFKVSIKIDNKIIACGRLIGDYSCKGLLSDILVHPDYQGKGYGKKIVTTLLNLVEKNLKEGELFQIEATPTNNNRDFYIKCGMKYKPENQDGVYIWLKK